MKRRHSRRAVRRIGARIRRFLVTSHRTSAHRERSARIATPRRVQSASSGRRRDAPGGKLSTASWRAWGRTRSGAALLAAARDLRGIRAQAKGHPCGDRDSLTGLHNQRYRGHLKGEFSRSPPQHHHRRRHDRHRPFQASQRQLRAEGGDFVPGFGALLKRSVRQRRGLPAWRRGVCARSAGVSIENVRRKAERFGRRRRALLSAPLGTSASSGSRCFPVTPRCGIAVPPGRQALQSEERRPRSRSSPAVASPGRTVLVRLTRCQRRASGTGRSAREGATVSDTQRGERSDETTPRTVNRSRRKKPSRP